MNQKQATLFDLGDPRQQMLQAALTCFLRSGFRGASVSDICKEANVSPGHLYYYFKSKEALVEGVAEAAISAASRAFENIAEEADILAALFSTRHIIISAKANEVSALNTELYAEAARNPRMMTLIRSFRERSLKLLTETIRQGQSLGQINPLLDPRSAAALFDSITMGQQIICAVHPDVDQASVTSLAHDALRRLFAPTAG